MDIIRVQSKKLTFLCERLEEWKICYPTDKIFIGGDFNVVPDLCLDCFPSRAMCHKFEENIVNLVTKVNLTTGE